MGNSIFKSEISEEELMDKVKKIVLPCFEEYDHDSLLKNTLNSEVKEKYNLLGNKFSEVGFDNFRVKDYKDFMETFDLELVRRPDNDDNGYFEFRSKTNDMVIFTSNHDSYEKDNIYFHYFGCSGTLEKVLEMFMYGISDKAGNAGYSWGCRAYC